MLDPAPAHDQVALIEHRRLSRCDRALGRVKHHPRCGVGNHVTVAAVPGWLYRILAVASNDDGGPLVQRETLQLCWRTPEV